MDIDYSLKKDIEKIVNYEIEPFEMAEDDVISLLENLVNSYKYLETKLNDLKKDVEDNYKPLTSSELYGVSDKDFI